MAYIALEHIDKYYGDQRVLRDLSLSVEKGSFVTLLGPSGCGKSTLLRCLAGLEPISSGRILLDGQDITHTKPAKRNVGMVFQQYSLFPTMNVYRNIAFGLKMKHVPREEADRRIRDALEMVNLQGYEKKYPSQLSGGEQQRVALCRCIVTKPKVLLMDEPFSAIDAKLRKELQVHIKEIHQELGMTTIFVTHDQDEAMTMSDTIHLMNQGIVEQSSTPLELYAHPRTTFAAGFMGNYNILDQDAFAQVTGVPCPHQRVCIRPELIHMSAAPFPQEEGSYRFQGEITRWIPQGNTILYHLQSHGVDLKVDILFDDGSDLFQEGQQVCLMIRQRDLLTYPQG